MRLASALLPAARCSLLRLGQDAEQVLHVMADLVRDHVGLRELARLAADVAAAESGRDLIEERGVEIDLLVGRAIERPHGGLRRAAALSVRSRRGRAPGPAPGSSCRPWRRRCFHVTSVLPSTLLTNRPMSSCGVPVRRAVVGACACGWLGPVKISAPPISRLGSMPSAQPTRPSTTTVPMLSPPPPIGMPKPPPPPPPPSPRRSSTLTAVRQIIQAHGFISLAAGDSADRRARRATHHHRADQRAPGYIVARQNFPSACALSIKPIFTLSRHDADLSVVGPASPAASPESEF